MRRMNHPWRRHLRSTVSITILFFVFLALLLSSLPASAQEGKYDAVYESLHENPVPDDALKTTAPEPVTDEALSLHPEVDIRNADDLPTAITSRDDMPPVISIPTGVNSSLNAGVNRRGPGFDSPNEFHRVTDSNQNDDDVYYLNLNIRF